MTLSEQLNIQPEEEPSKAIEFLFTYGWAIIVVTVVVGVLLYLKYKGG